MRGRLRLRHPRAPARGAAAVELALLLPLLLVLVCGLVDFGRAVMEYATLVKGARAASRYLAVNGVDNARLATARNLVVCGKPTCATGEVVVSGLASSAVSIEFNGAGLSQSQAGLNQQMTNVLVSSGGVGYGDLNLVGVTIRNYPFTFATPIGELMGLLAEGQGFNSSAGITFGPITAVMPMLLT